MSRLLRNRLPNQIIDMRKQKGKNNRVKIAIVTVAVILTGLGLGWFGSKVIAE